MESKISSVPMKNVRDMVMNGRLGSCCRSDVKVVKCVSAENQLKWTIVLVVIVIDRNATADIRLSKLRGL